MIGWKPGEKIDLPGVYPSIPIDDYHSDICVGHSTSHSMLELLFRKSPAHYFDRHPMNPEREVSEATEAMNLGRAAHHLFLGEREFGKHYVARPKLAPDGAKWHGNNLSCKAWMAKQAKAGLTVLTPDQIDRIQRMRKSLAQEPLIQAGILDGRIEQSFVWQDDETGIWCKARPDVVPNDSGDFVDLKVVADISETAIRRQIAALGYHRQAAMVLEGAHRLLDIPWILRDHGNGEGMSFTFVFVESVRPHCVQVVTLKPIAIQSARADNHAALKVLRNCLDNDDWPGPSGRQVSDYYIDLPKYAIEDDEYRRARLLDHIRGA